MRLLTSELRGFLPQVGGASGSSPAWHEDGSSSANTLRRTALGYTYDTHDTAAATVAADQLLRKLVADATQRVARAARKTVCYCKGFAEQASSVWPGFVRWGSGSHHCFKTPKLLVSISSGSHSLQEPLTCWYTPCTVHVYRREVQYELRVGRE